MNRIQSAISQKSQYHRNLVAFVLYNYQVKFVQLQVCIRYFEFQPKIMLTICLCASTFSFIYFNMSIHPKIQNQVYKFEIKLSESPNLFLNILLDAGH